LEPIVSFGCWLTLRRKALRLTRDELSRRADCAAITLRKIEADERRPSQRLAERLAEHLAIPWGERDAFVRAARAELRVDRLPPPGGPADAPLLLTAGVCPASLPILPTPLIGRAEEVAAVQERLLHADVRLLTLTGAPGIGKTRLSLQVATDLRDTFPDGVAFIPLAPISDPRLVISTVARALGVAEISGQPLLQRLGDYVRSKHLLLVLDNFEQVLPAAPDLAELLAVAPRLKIMVTSRTALRLASEQLVAVPPLPVPDLSRLPPDEAGLVAALTNYAAVDLFVQRARAVLPAFAMRAENARSVAAICARLDGLPLAIELAAARIQLFTPVELLARLDGRFALLTRGATDAPPRQQALRRAIDWSHDLLDGGEQALFRRLGVFVGRCTFVAVEAVCLSGGDGTETTPLHERLADLLDDSLLERAEGVEGETRFGMLETIREYALERLEASGDAPAIRRRHRDYYLDLELWAFADVPGPVRHHGADRLEVELDNVRQALAWSLAQGEADPVRRMMAYLPVFWYFRGLLAEGRRWAEHALAAGGARPDEPRASALLGAGFMAWAQGDHDRAAVLLEEALAIFQRLDAGPLLARTLYCLGLAAQGRRDHDRAARLYEEALERYRVLGNEPWAAHLRNALGTVAYEQRDDARTTPFFEAALREFRALGIAWGQAVSLGHLARLALRHQEGARAADLFATSLTLLWEERDKATTASCLIGLADAATMCGQHRRAARLFGAAEALRESIGAPQLPPSCARRRRIELTRNALSDGAFTAEWATGKALPLEDAVAEAAAVPPAARTTV